MDMPEMEVRAWPHKLPDLTWGIRVEGPATTGDAVWVVPRTGDMRWMAILGEQVSPGLFVSKSPTGNMVAPSIMWCEFDEMLAELREVKRFDNRPQSGNELADEVQARYVGTTRWKEKRITMSELSDYLEQVAYLLSESHE